MAIVFDGREFARKLTERLKAEITAKNRKLKLVTILDPEDRGSVVYTNLKAKKAEELGIGFEEHKIQDAKNRVDEVKKLITQLNQDETVNGIMIQLPFGGEREVELVNLIKSEKDVDGLRLDSPYVPATVRAVMEILQFSVGSCVDIGQLSISQEVKKLRVVVVGAKGEVGGGIIRQFSVNNYQLSVNQKVYELDLVGMGRENFEVEKIKEADVVISCTGHAGLIQSEMVKPGVIAIDVGYPGGDFAPDVAEKAGFFTPVPGGVGPVTVVMLFANLINKANE